MPEAEVPFHEFVAWMAELRGLLPPASELRALADRCRDHARLPEKSFRLGWGSKADANANLFSEVMTQLRDWADRLESAECLPLPQSPAVPSETIASNSEQQQSELAVSSEPPPSPRPEDRLANLLDRSELDTSELRRTVTLLPEAQAGGYWQEALMELYVKTWGEFGATWRSRDPVEFNRFTTALAELLQKELQFETFSPVALHDVREGWLLLIPGSRPLTGLVTKLHRPGLIDGAGHLRIPAIAEVE